MQVSKGTIGFVSVPMRSENAYTGLSEPLHLHSAEQPLLTPFLTLSLPGRYKNACKNVGVQRQSKEYQGFRGPSAIYSSRCNSAQRREESSVLSSVRENSPNGVSILIYINTSEITKKNHLKNILYFIINNSNLNSNKTGAHPLLIHHCLAISDYLTSRYLSHSLIS